MASNSFGRHFRITTWGESHGQEVGVVIDGMPAGIHLETKHIEAHLRWRRPGTKLTSPRQEPDTPEIRSGLHNHLTTGAPISIAFRNCDARPDAYQDVAKTLRPGHAHYSYQQKYGVYDHRGGGRASARETVCRVAAGAVAETLLQQVSSLCAYAYVGQMGSISLPADYQLSQAALNQITSSPVFCPDKTTSDQMITLLQETANMGDSLGGTVHFYIDQVPTGLGDPIYQKLEAQLAAAMLSIPASKGFDIGEGFAATTMRGSQHNDALTTQGPATNHAGGILAGISTGQPIIGRVAFKPTSSIRLPQKTITTDGEATILQLSAGHRHDPCIAIRATAVVKAMCLITLADAYLGNQISTPHYAHT